jgi:hypothetical protein
MYTPTHFLLLHLKTYHQLASIIFAASQDTTHLTKLCSSLGSGNGSSQG